MLYVSSLSLFGLVLPGRVEALHQIRSSNTIIPYHSVAGFREGVRP